MTGTVALGGGGGILISGNSTNNVVGGTTTAARNVVAGNVVGIVINTAASSSNTVQGNYIGVGADGSALGNLSHGVRLVGTGGTTLGGNATGAGNVIANNGGWRIRSSLVVSGTGHRIAGNQISRNGRLGIDLGRTV